MSSANTLKTKKDSSFCTAISVAVGSMAIDNQVAHLIAFGVWTIAGSVQLGTHVMSAQVGATIGCG